MKITKITKIKNNSKKYDIEVKENHNFFANGILVHNCTMYNDYIHARSINSGSHESRNWVKGLWSQINYMIDENMRICGENVYAQHCIEYDDLESYFYVFSIWIDNKCLEWNDTVEYAEVLGLKTVPVIYDGIFDINKIKQSFLPYKDKHEGYVIRLKDEFSYFNFKNSVAKYVQSTFRDSLNETNHHWMTKKVVKNKLKTEKED